MKASTPERQWNDWRWQIEHAFRRPEDLSKFLGHPVAKTPYRMMITPYLADKIGTGGPSSALWKQFVPHERENAGEGEVDPIGDHLHQVGGQLVHRYHNRALYLPTTVCPVDCRYCFRKLELSRPDELFTPDFQGVLEYLREHPEIEEIIYSGGDPLMLSARSLERSLNEFASIESIKYVRFHTRVPSTLPQRLLDPELLSTLEGAVDKFVATHLVIHVNHLSEIDEQVRFAIEKLESTSISLLSQSVLLRGVNDNPRVLRALFLHLHGLGVRPYYLHHPDPVEGGGHFMLSLGQGWEIYDSLRKIVPGWVLPQYVVERPHGAGKVAVGR